MSGKIFTPNYHSSNVLFRDAIVSVFTKAHRDGSSEREKTYNRINGLIR